MKDENKPATKADVRQIVKTELKKELKKELKDVVRKKDIEDVVRKKDIEDVVRKKDIEDVVRKKDIEDVVRKKDIEDVVRKKDIEDVVRKKDIEDVVRKKDIEDVVRKKDWTEDLFRRAQDYFVSRAEFNEFRDWTIENMYTKKDHEKTLIILDAIVQRLDDMSLDLKLANSRIDRTEDTGENHEKRIAKLEGKVLT